MNEITPSTNQDDIINNKLGNKQELQRELLAAINNLRNANILTLKTNRNFQNISSVIQEHQCQLANDVNMLVDGGSDFSACIIAGVIFEQALLFRWISIDMATIELKAKEWWDFGHISVLEQYENGIESEVKALEIVNKHLLPFWKDASILKNTSTLLKTNNYFNKWYNKYKMTNNKRYIIQDIAGEVDKHEKKLFLVNSPVINEPNKYVYSMYCKYKHNDSYRFITNALPDKSNPDYLIALFTATFSLQKVLNVIQIVQQNLLK
jgi:hypothetical protein